MEMLVLAEKNLGIKARNLSFRLATDKTLYDATNNLYRPNKSYRLAVDPQLVTPNLSYRMAVERSLDIQESDDDGGFKPKNPSSYKNYDGGFQPRTPDLYINDDFDQAFTKQDYVPFFLRSAGNNKTTANHNGETSIKRQVRQEDFIIVLKGSIGDHYFMPEQNQNDFVGQHKNVFHSMYFSFQVIQMLF